MFSKYTWGDFGIFILCLIPVYYVVVVLIYYRPQALALLSGKKLAPAGPGAVPSPRRARPVSADDDLISTSSAFPSTPAAEPDTTSTETGAGAAQNLTGGQEQLVAGSLPDSVAATGDNIAPTEVAASEATAGTMTTASTAVEEAEDEPIPLDVVSDETKRMLLSVSDIEKGTKEGNISETLPTFVDDENDIAYEATAQPSSNELEEFSVPLTSTLNIVSEQSAVFNADDVSSFLTELQDGPAETIPAKFANTTLGLVEDFSQKQQEAAAALDDMFASVNMGGM